jgi:hypothetical protein
MRRCLSRPVRVGVAAAAATAAWSLSACGGPPQYQFASSSADDVVFRLPWQWSQVRSGAPVASDGTVATDGSWFAVYDGDPHPNISHVASLSVTSPLVLARTVVVDKATGAAVTDDQLRDVALPVTAAGRASQTPAGAVFKLIIDQQVRTRTEHGVHVMYSYDLGKGPEVFDQVAVVDATKTRVHLLIVHCTRACFDANRADILVLIGSFTVKSR